MKIVFENGDFLRKRIDMNSFMTKSRTIHMRLRCTWGFGKCLFSENLDNRDKKKVRFGHPEREKKICLEQEEDHLNESARHSQTSI